MQERFKYTRELCIDFKCAFQSKYNNKSEIRLNCSQKQLSVDV